MIYIGFRLCYNFLTILINPKKVKSNSVPIIFDPRVSGSLLSLFIGGISGQAIARGTSFLKDKMNNDIFKKNVSRL